MQNRSKLGIFLDNTSLMLISVLLAFIFLKQFIKNNLLCLTLSILFGFIILKIILYFQNKKYTKLEINKNEIKNIDKANFELRKLQIQKQVAFFKTMFKNMDVVSYKNYLIIEKQILFILKLNVDIILPQDIFEAYQTAKQQVNDIKEVVILCNKTSPEINNILSQFSKDSISFAIFTPVETYALMKKHNTYPYINNNEKTQKINNFLLIKRSFVKKQAKIFIKCGLLLYFSSLFLPFTTHYLIWASVCLILGAICLCTKEKDPIITPLTKQLILN